MGFHWRQKILLSLSVLFVQVAAGPQEPEVHTKLGSLKGLHVSVKGQESGAHAYLGVPFAKPPVGPLRLAAPQPVEPWEGVRDATKQPHMCIQMDLGMAETLKELGFDEAVTQDISEDCLYVNIYTPANKAPNTKLPVMVWIHGGAFLVGSAPFYDASALAAYQNVVVVVIQYRLGVLGFLSTGDEHLPGNFGLLDQIQALRWTQEHIHNFGGDPNSVTIFGESAGGVSVSLLLLSPLSKGLFHRAIAESGTAAIDMFVEGNPLHTAQILANRSGCSVDSTKEIADCMKNLDIKTIVSFTKDYTLRFPINVDGHFLEKPINELLQKQEFHMVPLITGVTDDEGGWLLANFYAGPNWTEGVDRERLVQMMTLFYPGPEKALFRDLVIDEYIGSGEDPIKNRDGLTELLGDIMFVVPTIKIANAHRDAGGPVYLYQYQHIPSFISEKRPSFTGTDHADDLFSVFGFCFTTHMVRLKACTDEDKQMSKNIMSYWGNFARTGSPNGQGLVHWPKYSAGEEYLEIQAMEQVGRRQLKGDRVIALTETIPKKIEEQKLEVHTKLGSLKGLYASVQGRRSGAHAYLGVPFAKPPVGPLRLVAPQPVEPWEGVRDATKQPYMCIQSKETVEMMLKAFDMQMLDFPDMSEDCLYLNIYTPANKAPGAKLPVMVWIHGGGFVLGSASFYDASALAAYQDVVVVAIQYRLGVLGFLSSGDEHLPGNYGMLDQIQALRWTQEHIHNFGGDPNSVTIFGESAGGVSVSLLLLSPLSEGLFHRAIAESGTAAMDLLIGGDPLQLVQTLANRSGCGVESLKEIVDCMKKVDLNTLLSFTRDSTIRYSISTDGHFLKKPINELIQKQEFHIVPLMTGVNNDEGGFLLGSFFGGENWTEGVDQQQLEQMMSLLYPEPNKALFRDLMIAEYIGNGEDRVKNRDGLTEILGDMMFVVPAIKIANAHRDAGGPVYMYEFQHIPSFLGEKRPSFVKSDHGDELLAVFGFCFTNHQVKLNVVCTEEDKLIIQTMMSYWGNFARTGSPDGQGLVHWPKYSAEEEYLEIQAMEQVVRRQLKRDRYIALTETIPQKIEEHKIEVHTKLGSLKGLYASVQGRRSGAHAYLGVPFAKPPVGPLRLVAPQPVEPWEEMRDATKQPHMCVQSKEMMDMVLESFDFQMLDFPDMSEDCLYLNIYTPANKAPGVKLPVMLWIHGGGFVLGSGSLTDASALAAYEDVVVVVIQYRLGVLGFLSTGDEHLPGSFGLLDQIQALRWTQEHIHSFGGDPNSVTIFGESAGGVSVNLLLLSPLSKGLFHRAIAESGTAQMDALFLGNPLHTAQILANRSGCSMESTKEIADCLKKVDADTIVTFAKDPTLQYPMTIDGHFLEKPIKELIQKQEFLTVPFITGVTSDEGGWLLTNYFGGPNWTEGIDQQQFVQLMSIYYPGPEKGLFRDLVTEEYIGNGEDRVKNRAGLTELIGDTLFVFPAIKTANAHRDAGGPVYLYEFQHIPSILREKRPSFVKSDHGDELFAVFGMCFTSQQVKINSACSEEDKQMSKTIMSYWGNFARTGSPNGQGLVHWPKYGAGEEYLQMQAKEQVVRHQLKKERFSAFTETIPEKAEQHKPEVHTKLGSLKGLYVSVKGKSSGVHSYLGVPFAKPPVGPLRLAAPQPVEPWEGVRDATKLPSMCVQNKAEEEGFLKYFNFDLSEPVDISEDCLYLNIHTPATRAPNAKLPVMVWIHGGAFIVGSASSYDGTALAAYQDVVVVVIQYRLGLLGLLSTGDEHLPGNFGMLDQIQALRWTQEHIHNFGGDPNSVTIFGESAGGVSVSLLLLSPLSEGLFHRAIAESGTALTDELIGGNPLQLAQKLAVQAGCSVESTKAIADCMKRIDLDTIITLSQDLTVWYPMNIDGHFLKKPINELFQKREFLTVPLMTGVTDHEVSWILRSFIGGINWAEGTDREQLLQLMSFIFPGPDRALFRDLMIDEYIGSGEDKIKNRDGLTELLGDEIFVAPAIQTANAHRDAGGAVFFYEFQHIPSFMREKRPSFVRSDHADELFSVFGMCFTTQQVKLNATCSEEDKQMSKTIMSYWGNFARTGSPDGPGLVHWPKYGAGEEYLEIQAKQQVVHHQLKRDRVIAITETIPKKIQQQNEKRHSEL